MGQVVIDIVLHASLWAILVAKGALLVIQVIVVRRRALPSLATCSALTAALDAIDGTPPFEVKEGDKHNCEAEVDGDD